MNKRWLISGGSAAVIILALIVIFTVMANQHKPAKTVDAFNQAVEDEDVDTLKKLLEPGENNAEINKASLSAFVNYLQANNESFQVIKDGLKKQIDDEDFTSSKEQVSLVKDGKVMGVFPNYKLKVKTVNLKAKGQADDDNVQLAMEGFKKPLDRVDKKKEIYGPILPGEYKVKATVKNELGEFTKEEKKDVWGDADVSFLIDDEKLARDDKDVQKDIVNAANMFNEDMSVYVTSDFNPDKFTNGTDDLKEILTGLDNNFEAVKEHVEQIESQFLGSTVNMDEFELTQFDGDWQAQVTMLVDYDEKIKLEEDDDSEDVSYKDLRQFSLKYDRDNEKWLIDDFTIEDADESEADEWDNKEVIELDDPPVRKWSEEDSFI